MTGRVERHMAAAALGPRLAALAPLVRALSASQVETIKATADVTTAIGMRDYSLVVIILRLGQRAGEVAGPNLDDLDRHHGQLTMHG